MAETRVTPLRPPHRCPGCGRSTADREHYPFCSSRCRDRDLNRWLSDVYRVPGEPLEGDPEAGERED